MYEIKVTKEFLDVMKTVPSEYLVVLISQILKIKDLEGGKEHDVSESLSTAI